MTGVFVALLQEGQADPQVGGFFGTLGRLAEGFIGLFQEGADTFVGFVRKNTAMSGSTVYRVKMLPAANRAARCTRSCPIRLVSV